MIKNTDAKSEENEIRKKLEKRQENINIRHYKSTIRTHLLTSRFNTETRKQNDNYRNEKWPNGCLYCSPEQISQNIPIDAKLIVLEMDNDKNQIFIKNFWSLWPGFYYDGPKLFKKNLFLNYPGS